MIFVTVNASIENLEAAYNLCLVSAMTFQGAALSAGS
jgi:hypothetical protein